MAADFRYPQCRRALVLMPLMTAMAPSETLMHGAIPTGVDSTHAQAQPHSEPHSAPRPSDMVHALFLSKDTHAHHHLNPVAYSYHVQNVGSISFVLTEQSSEREWRAIAHSFCSKHRLDQGYGCHEVGCVANIFFRLMLDCALGPASDKCVAAPLSVGGAGLGAEPSHRTSPQPQPTVVVRTVVAELPSPLFIDPAAGEGGLARSLEQWLALVADNLPRDQLPTVVVQAMVGARAALEEASTRWWLENTARGYAMTAATAEHATTTRPVLYYINLNRRHDRRVHMEGQLAALPREAFDVRRFAAYDALTHEFSADDLRHIQEDEWRAHNQQYQVPNASMPALICNVLAHFEIWRSLLRTRDPYLLVMQDDVILLKDDFADEVGAPPFQPPTPPPPTQPAPRLWSSCTIGLFPPGRSTNLRLSCQRTPSWSGWA